MNPALHHTQSWDTPTQPGIHCTEPGALDCPVIQQHLDEQRYEFRAAMARIALAIHPDDTVPASLHAPAHITQTGDRWHELGWAASVLAASVGALVVITGMAMGWLK